MRHPPRGSSFSALWERESRNGRHFAGYIGNVVMFRTSRRRRGPE